MNKQNLPNTPTLPTTPNIPNIPNNEDRSEAELIAEMRIKQILSKPRATVEQLKGGVHDGVYYFGTGLTEDNKIRPAVVTSDKRIFIKHHDFRQGGELQRGYDQIKNDFGLNYRYDFETDVIDGNWSHEGIKRWLFEKNYEPSSIKELFDKIVALNKQYMDYPDETAHAFVALDVISTYYLPLFEAHGRTFLEAEPGSGKTRQCTIYKLLSCYSLMSNDITAASFFRIMEGSCWTLIVDDFDKLSDELKNAVLQHYRAGYKRTSKAVRTGGSSNSRKRPLDAFRDYGHVVMNNTEGVERIDRERTNFLPILRTDSAVTNRLLDEYNASWQALRDELYASALTYWELVRHTYANLKSSFKARDYEITAPLLALANIVSGDVEAKLGKFLKDNIVEARSVDLESDWFYLALSRLKLIADGGRVALSELAFDIASDQYSEVSFDFKSKKHAISIFLGRKLSKLPGILKLVRPGNKVHVEIVSQKKLLEHLVMKGWHDDV